MFTLKRTMNSKISWSRYNNNYNNYNNDYTTWNYRKINKINLNKYSAGILPYTFDQKGSCIFLLGKDLDGDWSDFGGRCEYIDKNDEKNTASREFFEETLGAVLSVPECIDKINGCTKIISKTLNGSPYYMYLMYIDYQNYSEFFNKTSNFIKYINKDDKKNLSKLIEKVAIRWVTLDTIINCIEGDSKSTPLPLRGIFYKTITTNKEQLLFLQK